MSHNNKTPEPKNGHWHPELGTIEPLPKARYCRPISCMEILMDNGESYIVRVGELVSVQFIMNDQKIIVRRGRVYDLKIANYKNLSNSYSDNISNITLDCSEQFSQKIITIKVKDILRVGGFTEEYPEYPEKSELEPGWIEGPHHPVRNGGLKYEEETKKHISKPSKSKVNKVDPVTGEFNDLAKMNENKPPQDMLKPKKMNGVRIGAPVG